MTENEPLEESTEESQEETPKASGSGFIGAVAGSGRPQPEPEKFEEVAERAYKADPEAFLRGAASTHSSKSSDESEKSEEK